jgi:hypothetical protein
MAQVLNTEIVPHSSDQDRTHHNDLAEAIRGILILAAHLESTAQARRRPPDSRQRRRASLRCSAIGGARQSSIQRSNPNTATRQTMQRQRRVRWKDAHRDCTRRDPPPTAQRRRRTLARNSWASRGLQPKLRAPAASRDPGEYPRPHAQTRARAQRGILGGGYRWGVLARGELSKRRGWSAGTQSGYLLSGEYGVRDWVMHNDPPRSPRATDDFAKWVAWRRQRRAGLSAGVRDPRRGDTQRARLELWGWAASPQSQLVERARSAWKWAAHKEFRSGPKARREPGWVSFVLFISFLFIFLFIFKPRV